MGNLIDRQAAIKAVEDLSNCYNGYSDAYDKACIIGLLEELPPAEYTCGTCCYWGNRMILRDGSLGDCGNFEKNLSKDFFCAWWSQKEKEGEQDG